MRKFVIYRNSSMTLPQRIDAALVQQRRNRARLATLSRGESVTKRKLTHGGARPGAGRKKKPDGALVVRMLISLPPGIAQRLRMYDKGRRSHIVAEALEQYMPQAEMTAEDTISDVFHTHDSARD